MKTRMAIIIASLALSGTANSHDFSSDIICAITDTSGKVNGYAFANNTENADGSVGGTMVETRYAGGRITAQSEPGSRPVWVWYGNKAGGMTLESRDAPGWKIGMDPIRSEGDNVSAHSVLIHG